MKKTLFGILVAAVAWIALGAAPNGRMNRNAPQTGAPRRVRPVETNRIERQFSLETTAVKNDVKTVSGKFHAGMTWNEAEESSLVGNLFSRDFNDIDRNGDGVLSVREICEERKLETDKEERYANLVKKTALGFGIIGMATIFLLVKRFFATTVYMKFSTDQTAHGIFLTMIMEFCISCIFPLPFYGTLGFCFYAAHLNGQSMMHSCETKEIIIKQYAAEGAGTIRHGTLEVTGVFAPGGENAVGSLAWEPATMFSGTMRLNVGDRIVCESAFLLADVTIEVLDRENLKNVASWTVVSSAGRRITGHVKGHNLEGTGYTVHTTPGAVEIVKCGEDRP